MKISELIERLNAIRKECGDLQVLVYDGLDPSSPDDLANIGFFHYEADTPSAVLLES